MCIRDRVIGYSFDLRSNTLTAETMPNPNAGKEHRFDAYRLQSQLGKPVTMAVTSPSEVMEMMEEDTDDE